jgi:thioesterase domain-containing protein
MAARRLGWRVADRVSFESDNLSELKGRAKVRHVTEKARRAFMRTWARIPIKGTRSAYVTEIAASESCSRAHLDAYWAYDPKSYDGPVTVVYSSVQPRGVTPDPTLGWGHLFEGEVHLHKIPSHHGNILHGERIDQVADVIRSTVAETLLPDRTT